MNLDQKKNYFLLNTYNFRDVQRRVVEPHSLVLRLWWGRGQRSWQSFPAHQTPHADTVYVHICRGAQFSRTTLFKLWWKQFLQMFNSPNLEHNILYTKFRALNVCRLMVICKKPQKLRTSKIHYLALRSNLLHRQWNYYIILVLLFILLSLQFHYDMCFSEADFLHSHSV